MNTVEWEIATLIIQLAFSVTLVVVGAWYFTMALLVGLTEGMERVSRWISKRNEKEVI